MNKRILLLYFKEEQKSRFLVYSKIFKALFRKFRVSADFDFLHLDTSPVCREAMVKKLREMIKPNEVIYLCHDEVLSPKEAEFLEEGLDFYATSYYNAGISIFFPYEKTLCKEDNKIITESVFCSKTHLEYLVSLCSDYAYESSKALFVCTKDMGIDAYIFKELESVSQKYRHLDINHMPPSEIIRQSASCIMMPCAILTRKHIADIILTHTCTMQKSPGIYSILYSSEGKIYKPLCLPGFFDEGHKMLFVLFAFSAFIQEGLNMESAALWIRKSIDTALLQVGFASRDDLSCRIIENINEPMRKRK